MFALLLALIFILSSIGSDSHAFLVPISPSIRQPKTNIALHNIDILIREVFDDPDDIDRYLCGDWEFGLLRSNETDAAADLAMESFFKPRLSVSEASYAEMSGFERAILSSVVSLYTSIEEFDAKMSNKWGFESRSGPRLRNPDLSLSVYSFILAARPRSIKDSNLRRERKFTGITKVAAVQSERADVRASFNYSNDRSLKNKTEKNSAKGTYLSGLVEISMEPPNGQLSPPLKNPFRVRLNAKDEPYLCNLCVSVSCRGRGLGMMLCDLAEAIAASQWNRKMMYLHVENDNIPAQSLYVKSGYRPAYNPMSAVERKLSGTENIAYYSKQI